MWRKLSSELLSKKEQKEKEERKRRELRPGIPYFWQYEYSVPWNAWNGSAMKGKNVGCEKER